MITVKKEFTKGGKKYKKGSKASFTENDEKMLISNGWAEESNNKQNPE